jgi:hypothetical protein
MKRASITEAKKNLSALRRSEDDGRLTRLVREGTVRPARSAVPKSLLASEPPRPKDGVADLEET